MIRPDCNKNVSDIKSIFHNDSLFSQPNTIASIFNSYFSSVGQIISDSFPNDNQLENSTIQNLPVNSFFFSYVNNKEVKTIISSLKNKSSHISTYPAKVIKFLEPLITPVLTKIVNKSLTSGKFPTR